MSDNNTEFFGDSNIKAFVEDLWASVFLTTNQVIRDTKMFGFNEIEVIPNPNIHQIIASLAVISNTLDMILTMDGNGQINIGDTRQIMNAKQQIFNMETIAAALKSKNRSRYEEAVNLLQRQAQI